MNKGEFVEKLSGRLGDNKTSSRALDAVVSEIEDAVGHGQKVNISGFGVFEPRERAARTARNPRTGEPVKVKKTTVPAFRPGSSFKGMVNGSSSSSGGSRTSAARSSQPSARSNSSQPTARSQPAGRASTRNSTARSSGSQTVNSTRGSNQRAQQQSW